MREPLTQKQITDAFNTLEASGDAKPLGSTVGVRLTLTALDKVLSTLTDEEKHLDEIIEASGLSRSEVLSVLTYLELSAKIEQFPGKKWALKKGN